MKLFTKFLLFILVLGLAGPFLMKRPDGRPWMDYRDLIPDTDKLAYEAKSALNDAKVSVQSISDEKAGQTKVYRWRDASGKWHMSDKPLDSKAEELWLDPDANIIQSQAASQEPLAEREPDQDSSGPSQVPYPMTVSPDQVQQLINDSKNVQKLMDQRAESLDGI